MARPKHNFHLWVVAAMLMCIALGGTSCQFFARRPSPPHLSIELSQYSGTALSGPTDKPLDLAAGASDAWGVRITIIALDAMPTGAPPLGAQANFVAVTRGRGSVLPTGRLAVGTRMLDENQTIALLRSSIQADVRASAQAANARADAKSAARGSQTISHSVILGQYEGALLPGVTISVTATEPLGMIDPLTDHFEQRGFAVLLTRAPLEPGHAPINPLAPPPIRVGVMAEDLYSRPKPIETAPDEPTGKKRPAPSKSPTPAPKPPPAADAAEEAELNKTTFVREMAMLDRVAPPDAPPFAIVVPMQFQSSSARAIAAVIEVEPAAPARVFLQTTTALKQSIGDAAHRPSMTPFASGGDSTIETSLESLQSNDRRRSALVFLAGLGNADLCENVAMVADDATLKRLADQILHRINAEPSRPDVKALGWMMESTTLSVLSNLLDQSQLPPELAAVLTAYAGEAGRHSDSIDEISKRASGWQDLSNRLQAENLIYLEDDSPAARVRAYDWLQTRKQAPPGFDPLGSPRQRRDALDKFEGGGDDSAPPATQTTAQSTTQPAPPAQVQQIQ